MIEESDIVAVVEEEQPIVVEELDTEVAGEAEQPIVESDEESQEAPVAANGSEHAPGVRVVAAGGYRWKPGRGR